MTIIVMPRDDYQKSKSGQPDRKRNTRKHTRMHNTTQEVNACVTLSTPTKLSFLNPLTKALLCKLIKDH